MSRRPFSYGNNALCGCAPALVNARTLLHSTVLVNTRYVVLHPFKALLFTPGSYPNANGQLLRFALSFWPTNTGFEPGPPPNCGGALPVKLSV